MIIKITIDDELYRELKNVAKAENQFIMGFCDKLFTEKVKDIIAQITNKKGK